MNQVNNPEHYNQNTLEVIEILKDQLSPEEFRGFLKGNILKYMFREPYKNGLEDIQKSAWYTNELINFEKELNRIENFNKI